MRLTLWHILPIDKEAKQETRSDRSGAKPTADDQKQYKDAAKRPIEPIKRTQNLDHPNPGIQGSVKGSFPFDGSYV